MPPPVAARPFVATILTTIVALALPLGASAAESCLPPVPRYGAGNYIVSGVLGDVVYARRGDRALALDAYVQRDGATHPAVIVVHGGGWTTGSREAHIGQLLELLTTAGYQWFAIDYRLGGIAQWRDAVEDVRAAVAFVRCNAVALKVDPDRVALMGEDAGAHLAAHAAARGDVHALVLIGSPFELAAGDTLPDVPSRAELAEASLLGPQGVAVRLTQPTYVIHGGDDSDVPAAQPKAFCDGTNAHGGRCALDVVSGASHRVENWWPSQWGYKPRLIAWLRNALGSGGPGEPLPAHELKETLAPGLHKRIVYSSRWNLTLDAWIPSSAGPHVPVLIVHGGGWEAGDRVTYITPLFRPLADAGLAWFSIDYRLTPDVTHPEQLQDVRDAIAFLRVNAAALRIDARKLVMVGESASAQMAAQIGTEDHELAGVVSFYGVYDLVPLSPTSTPRSLPARLFRATVLDDVTRGLLRQYSPIAHVRRDQPPMLLIHGTAEELWAQGQAMDQVLTAAGARHELLSLAGAPHGMENWEGHAEWLGYKTRVVEWIQAITGVAR
jgi:acetyl esterase